jgi:hypothetical protein
MHEAAFLPALGAYRSPGRAGGLLRVPPPSWRSLIAPLVRGAGFVALVMLPPVAFNLWVSPALTASGERLIPAINTCGGVFACLALVSFVVLAVVLRKRVLPGWQGMGRWSKVVYIALLFLAQAAFVLAGEVALFASSGGLHLFEPQLVSSTPAGDGRVAYLYEDGFLGCTYDVFVAAPYALTMHPVGRVTRHACEGVRPHIAWGEDRAPHIVGPDGTTLESQSLPDLSFLGGSGC